MDIRNYFNGNSKHEKNKVPNKVNAKLDANVNEEGSLKLQHKKEKKRKLYKLSSDSDGDLDSCSISQEVNPKSKDIISKKIQEIDANIYFESKKIKLQNATLDLSQFATTGAEREEVTPLIAMNIPPKIKNQKSVSSENKKIRESNTNTRLKAHKALESNKETQKNMLKNVKEAEKPIKKTPARKKRVLEEDILCLNDNDIKSNDIKKGKKNKLNSSEIVVDDDITLVNEKDYDKSASKKAYQSFIQRGGPQALGSKPLPQGKPNCLEGLTFVITGVLDSIERDTAKELIEQYGGKVTMAISKKTNYLVVGREPGASKISKAESLKTPKIDEDGLFKLIDSQPEKESKYVIYNPELDTKQVKDDRSENGMTQMPMASNRSNKKVSWRMNNNQDEVECITGKEKVHTKIETDFKPTAIIKNLAKEPGKNTQRPENEKSYMWVDKYKPKTTQEIIGQQGEKSSLHKLIQWLGDWSYNHSKSSMNGNKITSKKNTWGANQDSSQFKAAMLSGPPGVGKTTSAILACKELGFTYTELNASNIRSKKCLKDHFSDSLTSYNISKFIKGISGGLRSHVLIMDEVDGMAGNEDRGGVQELIALIKTSKLPIICICNQRSDPKMRTLVNYCYDLRFPKPRPEQIKEAMMSMLFKEKIQIEPAIVQQIIQASNNDIRQVIHSLSFFSSDNKCLKYHALAPEIKTMKKDMKMDDFEITRNVFMASSSPKSNPFIDKANLFFMDYSAIPLFIQENYINVQSFKANKDNGTQLNLLSKAADFISDGDLISSTIQKNNNWSLLPLSAIITTVAPGEILKGYFGSMINFPSWFGKNSKTNKFLRMFKELKMHTMLRTYSNWLDLNLDYMPLLKTNLLTPLLQNETDGISDVIKFMTYYYLQKEDVDNIMELSKWGTNAKDPFSLLNSKVKSNLTRSFNKLCPMVPYVLGNNEGFRKSMRKAPSVDYTSEYLEENENSDENNLDEDQDNNDSDYDFKANKMIKKKAKTPSKKIQATGKAKN